MRSVPARPQHREVRIILNRSQLGRRRGLLVLALAAGDRNQEPSAANTPTTVTTTSGTSGVADASSFFYRNEEWLEGLGSQDLDLEDLDAVFWHVFSKLPEEVLVYPS